MALISTHHHPHSPFYNMQLAQYFTSTSMMPMKEGKYIVLRLSTPILSRPQTSMLYNYAWEEYKNGWLSNPYLSAEVILCTA